MVVPTRDHKQGMPKTIADPNVAVCCGCDRNLPASAFYKCAARPNGLQSRCKDCDRQRQSDRYQTDGTFRRAKIDAMRRWNKDHPELAAKHSRDTRARKRTPT